MHTRILLNIDICTYDCDIFVVLYDSFYDY